MDCVWRNDRNLYNYVRSRQVPHMIFKDKPVPYQSVAFVRSPISDKNVFQPIVFLTLFRTDLACKKISFGVGFVPPVGPES